MSGSKPQPIPEFAAEGEIERVYHEIRETLRVSGVPTSLTELAGYPRLLPHLWDAVQPLVQTRTFETCADQLRTQASRAAIALGVPGASARAPLGESQGYRRRRTLDVYHYQGPKLLLLLSTLLLALESFEKETPLAARGDGEPVEMLLRGIPSEMHSIELVSEAPRDERSRALFEDIRRTLRTSKVPDEFRALAAWPEYLERAWGRLKIFALRSLYTRSAQTLRENARERARSLLGRFSASRNSVEKLGLDPDDIVPQVRGFTQHQAPLLIDVALLELDWRSAASLSQSPFPASSVPAPAFELRGVR